MSAPPTVVRVAIVNDSASVRAALRVAIESDESMVVVGEADDGHKALALVQSSRADVLLMDVVMPHDGYAATREVMRAHPMPILLVSSVVNPRDVEVAMESLRSGALAIVEQIPSPLDPTYRLKRGTLINLVRALAHVPLRKSPTPMPVSVVEAPPSVVVEKASRPRAVLGIAASTGGPNVIVELLRALRTVDLPPVLVVQHIAAGFSEGFARWLGERAERPCVLAHDGQELVRGTIVVAPDDVHVELDGMGRVALRKTPPVGRFRPSATPMLASIGRTHRSNALGVVLTGMGDDGADGAKVLRESGGKLIVQDESSSVVFGMPRAARDRAGADAVLSPVQMPSWIREWLSAS